MSPIQEPELLPGLPVDSAFRLFNSLRFLAESKALPRLLLWILSIPPILIWFAPGWLYRLTLKSTAWFWWPIAFLGADLQRSKNVEEFRRRAIESLWAKASIVIAFGTILAFVWFNFVQNGAVFEDNPMLTVFGYFFVVDWSFRPWQLLSITLAVMSIALVFLVDDASGQYRGATAKNDVSLLAQAERKFGWIERLVRLRLILFVLFTVVVGGHTLLYLNSLRCWLDLPGNVAHWAQWIYGDRMPKDMCIGHASSM